MLLSAPQPPHTHTPHTHRQLQIHGPQRRPCYPQGGGSVAKLAERDICLLLARHLVTLQGSIHLNGNKCHLMLKRGDV